MKSVFRSQTIVSVLCFMCKQEMQQDRSYFNLQLSIFESSFYYFSSFNQCKIRLYICIQFQCICKNETCPTTVAFELFTLNKIYHEN